MSEAALTQERKRQAALVVAEAEARRTAEEQRVASEAAARERALRDRTELDRKLALARQATRKAKEEERQRELMRAGCGPAGIMMAHYAPPPKPPPGATIVTWSLMGGQNATNGAARRIAHATAPPTRCSPPPGASPTKGHRKQ